MQPLQPRIPLVARDAYTDEQAALASGRDMYNLTRMFVQHPEFYRVFVPFVEKLMNGSQLPHRDREILILRTLGLCEEAYEENHHCLIGRKIGMSDAEIKAAKTGDRSEFAAFDRALVQAAEELVRERCMSEGSWHALSQHYTVPQMMEAVFVVGAFTMLSMATKSFGLPIDGSM